MKFLSSYKKIMPFGSVNFPDSKRKYKGWDTETHTYTISLDGENNYAYRLLTFIGNLDNNIGKNIKIYYKVNNTYYKIEDYTIPNEHNISSAKLFNSGVKPLPLLKKGDKISFWTKTDSESLIYYASTTFQLHIYNND
jgi:hypothetical protein